MARRALILTSDRLGLVQTMAREPNKKAFDSARSRLIEAGMETIYTCGYECASINDILKKSKVPKGSFYHYFDSKEAFGLEVAKAYHEEQMATTQNMLRDETLEPLERLVKYFQSSCDQLKNSQYKGGCMKCNLTAEMAASNVKFHELLSAQWKEFSSEIALCLSLTDLSQTGLSHLTTDEAADWMLNSWSGALTRMKAEGNANALELFFKSIFHRNMK
jgi:TetR/AcrR family transcriptional regulator, transcriptional repressor for nem operon